jgi:hypothetical protein
MRSSSTAATNKALSASELKNCADMMVEKPFFIVSRASRRRVGASGAVSPSCGRRFIAWAAGPLAESPDHAAPDRSPDPHRRAGPQPGAGARRRARCAGLGGGQGRRLRPRHRAAFSGLRGADGFALLDLAEAERVRALGWRGPVLLLEGCFEPRDLELCSRLDLWHVVHHDAQIDWLAAHKTQRPHRVFLKMNSGMNRLGFGLRPTAAPGRA